MKERVVEFLQRKALNSIGFTNRFRQRNILTTPPMLYVHTLDLDEHSQPSVPGAEDRGAHPHMRCTQPDSRPKIL
jgi:hypothetical protein